MIKNTYGVVVVLSGGLQIGKNCEIRIGSSDMYLLSTHRIELFTQPHYASCPGLVVTPWTPRPSNRPHPSTIMGLCTVWHVLSRPPASRCSSSTSASWTYSIAFYTADNDISAAMQQHALAMVLPATVLNSEQFR